MTVPGGLVPLRATSEKNATVASRTVCRVCSVWGAPERHRAERPPRPHQLLAGPANLARLAWVPHGGCSRNIRESCEV